MPDAHKNFATSLVATAPSPATSGTSLVVTGGEGSRFPAGSFNATICPATADATPANAEVVRATVSTDTFTITRAQEGSLARTVVVGDRIYAGATAKTLTDVENDPAFGGGGPLVPTGITYQNFSRWTTSIAITGATLASGTLKMTAIWLPAGITVTNISFVSGSTALTTAGAGPHAWAALFDSSRNLLRQSTDDTAATWAANTLKTWTLSSTFATTYTGLHYLGLAINCGSTGAMPTMVTGSNNASSILIGLAPILCGNSTTSITGTAPNPAGALTAVTNNFYCGVA